MEEIWLNKSLDSEVGGVVLIDGYIYGSGTKNSRTWQCLDWETGKQMYFSRELGRGTVSYADGRLYCFSQNGYMALVKPNPEQFQVISKFRIPYGTVYHLPHLVINKGKLYVRAGEHLMVYSISSS